MAEKMTLLPCPFCGGEAVAENYIVEAQVVCLGCLAKIVRSHGAHADNGTHDAIEAWNRRAQPAQAVDALQDAIFQIAERLGEVRDPDMDDMSWHTQLIARAQYLANAQAVDVGAIREVIAYLQVGHRFDVDMADKLTRAIGNARAEE